MGCCRNPQSPAHLGDPGAEGHLQGEAESWACIWGPALFDKENLGRTSRFDLETTCQCFESCRNMYIYLQRFLEATDIILSALCANVLNDFLRFGDQPEYSILSLRFFAKWSTSFLFHLQSEVAINQGFFSLTSPRGSPCMWEISQQDRPGACCRAFFVTWLSCSYPLQVKKKEGSRRRGNPGWGTRG